MPDGRLEIPSLEDIRRIFGNDIPAGPSPATPTGADQATPRPADPMENDDE